ncbi:hypothetical protein HDU67_001880 [Dinochytrium kinnereticum]|nr:hypothetical protein HDU67_001880 [Dinochytrium kinnereticum]
MDFFTNEAPSGTDYEAEEFEEENSPIQPAEESKKVQWVASPHFKEDGQKIPFKLLIVSFSVSISKLIRSCFSLELLGSAIIPDLKQDKNSAESAESVGCRLYKLKDGLGMVECSFNVEPSPTSTFELAEIIFQKVLPERILLIDSGALNAHFDAREVFTLKTTKRDRVFEDIKQTRPLEPPGLVKGLHAAIMTTSEAGNIPATSYILPEDVDVEFLLGFKGSLEAIISNTLGLKVQLTSDIQQLRTMLQPKAASYLYL